MTDDGPGQVIETRNLSLEGGTVSSAIGVGFQDPSDVDEEFGFSVALTEDVPPAETNETAVQFP